VALWPIGGKVLGDLNPSVMILRARAATVLNGIEAASVASRTRSESAALCGVGEQLSEEHLEKVRKLGSRRSPPNAKRLR
jgi:hypothetical protein